MKLTSVPITINGNVQYFEITYSSKQNDKQYIIESRGMVAIVDENLDVVSYSMPSEWLEKAIETLKYILDQGINFSLWI